MKFLFVVLMLILTTLLLTNCTPSNTDSKDKNDKKESDEQVDDKVFANVVVAEFPTDLTFSSDLMFFTEKGGELKVVKRGTSRSKTLKSFKVPKRIGYNEIGLLGIALSPNFEEDKKIYLYHSYETKGELLNKVVSIDSEQPEDEPKVIIDGIKGSRIHNGGKLAFGPDGKLYIATGDAGNKDSAQNEDSLNGKVLRVDEDGEIPSDNPFGNAAWSIGHRNIFGMTWGRKQIFMPGAQPEFKGGEFLFVTENGPEKDDEINEIKQGTNYGWPEVTGDSSKFEKPLIVFSKVNAPTGIIFYEGDKYPDLKGNLIFSDFAKGDIHEIMFVSSNESESLVIANAGQGVNAVAASPNGEVYVATKDKVKKMDLNGSNQTKF